MSKILNYNKNNKNIITISQELKNMFNDYKLDFDHTNNIVLLTKNNANIISKLVANDPEYYPFANVIYNYFGAVSVLNNTNNALFAVLREIDRDNNTEIWRYKKYIPEFNKFIKYILDPQNNFFNRIFKTDKKLPDDICTKCGSSIKSFSSKACKYLSLYIYNNKDSYYINDSVVRSVLPYYLNYYNISNNINNSNEVDKMKYIEINRLMDSLKNTSNSKHSCNLTKDDLDHILWYCYKTVK